MNYFKAMGHYYGYPICCIEFFGRRAGLSDSTLTPAQEAVHKNRGFIPCPKCAETVTAETLPTLLKDRVCVTPFPDGGSMHDLERWLALPSTIVKHLLS